MEAKGKRIADYSDEECYAYQRGYRHGAEAEAEISSKARQEYEHKIMIGVSVDEGNKAFKFGQEVGRQEVVECIRQHGLGYTLSIAKLKERGL